MSVRIRIELARLYLRLLSSKNWVLRWRGLVLYVPRGVFTPRFTISTDLLVESLEDLGKRVLDLGCGCGAIALYVAKHFDVEAVGYDPNPLCVAVARINAKLNNITNVVFTANRRRVARNEFDTVIVNPPYLPVEPLKNEDYGWCCGIDGRTLIDVLTFARRISTKRTSVYFAVSSLTPPKLMHVIAEKLGFRPELVNAKRTPLDTVYVYRLRIR